MGKGGGCSSSWVCKDYGGLGGWMKGGKGLGMQGVAVGWVTIYICIFIYIYIYIHIYIEREREKREKEWPAHFSSTDKPARVTSPSRFCAAMYTGCAAHIPHTHAVTMT